MHQDCWDMLEVGMWVAKTIAGRIEINRAANYAWTVESRRALGGSCNAMRGVAYPIH